MDLGSRKNNLGVDGFGEKQRDPLEAADKQPLSDENHWDLTCILFFLASDETDHLAFCLQCLVCELLEDKSFSVNTIPKLQLPDLTKLGTLSPLRDSDSSQQQHCPPTAEHECLSDPGDLNRCAQRRMGQCYFQLQTLIYLWASAKRIYGFELVDFL